MNLFTFQLEYKTTISQIYNTLITDFDKKLIKLLDRELFYNNLVLYLYNLNRNKKKLE